MWDNACPPQSARDVGPRSKVRDGDVGDDSNNFSLHVRCTCSSHGRPYDHMTPQDAGMARSFWLILSALLIGVDGYPTDGYSILFMDLLVLQLYFPLQGE